MEGRSASDFGYSDDEAMDDDGEFGGKEVFDGNQVDTRVNENANGDTPLTKEIDLEQKRKNMEKIEKEFADLKEKFFKDKIVALKREIEAIKNGFCDRCRELEQSRDDKVFAAEQWKHYQLQNINNVFDAERRQAEEEYKAEKRLIRERMMQALIDKKKKLTEEKMTMNLTEIQEDLNIITNVSKQPTQITARR